MQADATVRFRVDPEIRRLAAIETVRDSKSAQQAVRLAFELLVLTMTRSGRPGARSRRGAAWR